MPYLIDGHNLIPHLKGIQLGEIDDELKLVRLLDRFAGQRQTRVEVYFDRRAPGQQGTHSWGRVQARFVDRSRTADQALGSRLLELGKRAKNWTVVSSDREVIREAQGARSRVISSSEFAQRLSSPVEPREEDVPGGGKPPLSGNDVEYWLDQFNDR